jgi:arabinosyltransferase C
VLAVAVPWWWRRRAGTAGEAGRPRWPDLAVGTLVTLLVSSVLIQLGSAALATYRLRNAWSVGQDSLDTLRGADGCGFADAAVVLVGPRPLPPGPVDPAATPEPVPASAVPATEVEVLTDGAPADARIWSTYDRPRTGGGPAPAVWTPWLELASFAAEDALAVTLTGEFDVGTAVVVEYGRVGADGLPALVEALPVDFVSGSEGGWRQYVLGGRIHLPTDATLVRLRVEDPDLTEEGWVATTDPYRLEGTPLRELVGDDPVLLDWPIGFHSPCFAPPTIRDGMVEPVRWIVGGVNFDSAPEKSVVDERGGSYATADQVADTTEYVGFMPGVYPYQEWGVVTRLEPRLPGDGFVVEHSSRVVPGWGWWPGAGPGPDAS